MTFAHTLDAAPADRLALLEAYRRVRATTERLCAPLAADDYMVQAMTEVSPTKWHLAHVSWFFETFLLRPHRPGYRSPNDTYRVLFNSYYDAVGPQHARAQRGLLSRPTVGEVYAYRAHVDEAMAGLLDSDAGDAPGVADLTALGLHHEQQHQELILTDLKYNLGMNPLRPAYHAVPPPRGAPPPPLAWVELVGGVQPIGHDGRGFAFDNEWPRHRAYLEPFRLAARLVTGGEYLEFVRGGGYAAPGCWLSEGWQAVQAAGWRAPLYWEELDGRWWTYTLAGRQPLDEHAPVTHVSYYEADAFARWCGRRLPTEQEWEHAARGVPLRGNLQESAIYHPAPLHPAPPPGDIGGPGSDEVAPAASEAGGLGAGEAGPVARGPGGLRADGAGAAPGAAGRAAGGAAPAQMIGDVWEWTRSPYTPYPGYRPPAGAVGEYNGKFMVNQMVLRGGSCVTPQSHIRITYRNFFPPAARWQFSGIRLAEDA